MFKKFFKKFHLKLFKFYRQRANYHFAKFLGANYYVASKKQRDDLKCAFSGGLTHVDFSKDYSSVYPSIMRSERFPLG